MTSRFKDLIVNREYQFSLGVDTATGNHYLSTPITKDGQHSVEYRGRHTHAVEYEARFGIDLKEFKRFRDHPAETKNFITICRENGNGDRLIK
mgnify:CR=1 FL=1